LAPRDTFAGAMSTLFAMIPFEIARARGASEDAAFVVAWWSLLGLALIALVLRMTPLARKSYPMPVFREEFSVAKYLRNLALFAFALLGLSAYAWYQLQP
jgi:hypothetical protein